MKTDQKSIPRNIVIVLIIISLTTIFGCKWGSWSFDLFGGDPINGDDGDSSENGDFPVGSGIELFVVPVLIFHLLFFPPTSAVQKSTNLLSFLPHLIMDPISQRSRVSSIAEGWEMNLKCHLMGHGLHI